MAPFFDFYLFSIYDFLNFQKNIFFTDSVFLQNNNIWEKKKKIAIFPLFSILTKKFGARGVVNILLGSAGGLFQKI